MLHEGLSISVTIVAGNKGTLISTQLFNVFLFAQFLVRMKLKCVVFRKILGRQDGLLGTGM